MERKLAKKHSKLAEKEQKSVKMAFWQNWTDNCYFHSITNRIHAHECTIPKMVDSCLWSLPIYTCFFLASFR